MSCAKGKIAGDCKSCGLPSRTLVPEDLTPLLLLLLLQDLLLHHGLCSRIQLSKPHADPSRVLEELLAALGHALRRRRKETVGVSSRVRGERSRAALALWAHA